MIRSLERIFVKHMRKWAEEFYNDITSENLSPFAYLMGISQQQMKIGKVNSFLTKSMKRQIDFVKYYATCLMVRTLTIITFPYISAPASLRFCAILSSTPSVPAQPLPAN